jgi:large subunit ribosomal protein L21
MPYAIIRTGGKQYRVSQGDRLRVEKLLAEVGQEVQLPEVLAAGEGAALVAKAGLGAVTAKVVRHGRGTKIDIWTYKRRSGQSHRQGHRQDFTEIEITAIPAV